jgi:hypothetical protein|tara:strand:+ start:1913 stop:2110 length:198 start_codon:yes stop_codon:yes gene_type:complete
MANNSKKEKKEKYRANDGYKSMMPNNGLLSEAQHKKLLSGDSVELKNVPQKQMNYLLANNLIIKE